MADSNNTNGTKPDFDKLSKVEKFKYDSEGLYGPIADEFANKDLAAFGEESVQLLKHHGTYQQDNRDLRRERRKAGLDKAYSMMLRTRTPGGLMAPEQYILCDDLAKKYGQDDLRITSRQGFQFHGVLKGNLRSLIQDLNKLQQISTQGACGDVVRNVTSSSVSDIDSRFANINEDIFALAEKISTHFLPQATSYADLWLDDEKVEFDADGNVFFKEKGPSQKPIEPIYGKTYLPRKFKIGITADVDNSCDIFTNDVGVLAKTEKGKIVGYEILIGGGLGHSHSKPETYARIATPLTFVKTAAEVIPAIEGVVKAQRDHGNREVRHQARLKYTIDRMTQPEFKKAVEAHVGHELPEPIGVKPLEQPDYLGWHKQNQDGLNYVGVWIENGRIRDFENSFQFKSGLRQIIEEYKPSVRLTAHHNVVLANIKDSDVDAIQAKLNEFKIPTDKGISQLRRLEMACPALPLCGLALSEAERELPAIIEKIEAAGHADADVIIRITGCPNSCARPETAEIGIIGCGPSKYNLYTGADKLGTRMNELIAERLPTDDLIKAINTLLSAWKSEQNGTKVDFGDWANGKGKEAVAGLID